MEFSSDGKNDPKLWGDPPFPPECVPGKKIGVWLDRNQDGSTLEEPFLGTFVAYTGGLTAAANYNYYSASAHPIVGPTPVGFRTTVFFYEGIDGLAFNFFSNVDKDGSEDNIVQWDVTTRENNLMDNVLLSDDGGELKKISTSGNSTLYWVRDHYWSNTDGGVIGAFEGENWLISVKVITAGDNIDAGFYSSNGAVLPLRDGDNPVSSFIVGYQGYETCP